MKPFRRKPLVKSEPFALGGLANIYKAAYQNDETTLAFEVPVRKGRFVFLLFFSQEDGKLADTLHMFLRNTKVLLEFPLYGHHLSGKTNVYVTPTKERAIKAELGLTAAGPAFELGGFFAELNEGIPQQLPLRDTVRTLRENWDDVGAKLAKTVEEALKTQWIGIKRLPAGHHPKEVTLRKLYVHTDGRAEEVESLIARLKRANVTVAWAIPVPGVPGRSFADLAAEI